MSSNKGEDKYLSPVSGSIHKIFESGSAFFAISIAIAKVEPPDIPVIIPSALANLAAVLAHQLEEEQEDRGSRHFEGEGEQEKMV